MELKLFTELVEYLVGGGPIAVIVLLLLIIFLLLWERRILVSSITECHSKLVEAKEKEILSIKEINTKYHDGTMTTIHALKRDLKAIEKPETKDIIIKNIIALDNADEAMMRWMADFKVPEDKSQEAEYLKKEKEVIQSVSDQMYASIHQAQKLLDSLKTLK